MNLPRTATLALGLLATAGPAAAQAELVWLQNPETYTGLDSAAWSTPTPHDVEAADDFEFVGDVTRIIVSGNHTFQSPGPQSLLGVYVRFYESVGGAPGSMQYEAFVPAGDPKLAYTLPPEDIDVRLPQPFAATGQHFVSLQLVTPDAHVWRWWSAAHGTASATTLGSAHVRDDLAGGGWRLHEETFGAYQIDLAFELWGIDGEPPVDPVDPCGPWEELAVPALPSNYDTTVLRDVVAVGYDDVWAVGDPSVEVQFLQFDTKNLALHWDGQRWEEVPTPNPSVFPAPYGSTGLQAIDATSADNVWAVGNQERQDPLGFIIDQPLVLRWDGNGWQQIHVPNTNFDTYTYGVKMLAPDDVWLVGGGVTPCGGGLAIHYDGSGFQLHATPGPCTGLTGGTPGFDLVDADGVASDDVWAIGGGSDGDFSGRSYVLHWDGSQWSYVSSPTPGFARRLFDVHALAADDVWAVGQYEELVGQQVQFRAYAIRWNGSSWTLYDGATQSVGSLSVHAFAPDDVYSAGGQIHHFDGTAWSVADDLGQLTGEAISVTVAGLDAVAPCHLWAAGRKIVAGQIVPFTARQEGTSYWSVASRSCPTSPGPLGGLELVQPPRAGEDFVVAIGDPQAQTGHTPGGTLTVWALSQAPAPGGTCGLPVPRMGLGGSTGALLVDVSSSQLVLITSPVVWGGPASPALHSVALPADPSLVGQSVATQGVLVDPSRSARFVLTDALDATVGL